MGINLKGILATVAPALASMLPGPLGGMAKKVLAEALGTGTSDAEIQKELASQNPELLVKLREAEQRFLLEMEKAGLDLEKLAADDRANARAMQMSVRARTPAVLSAIVLLGWLVAFGFLIFRPLPTVNTDAIMLALGTLNSALMLVLSFYFGSSSGSRAKDDTISKLSA